MGTVFWRIRSKSRTLIFRSSYNLLLMLETKYNIPMYLYFQLRLTCSEPLVSFAELGRFITFGGAV
jgi:hypothetical protein